MDTEQFLQTLKLKDYKMAYPTPRVTRNMNLKNQDLIAKDRAFATGQTIVSFAAGISPQYRKDVLNCTLLAQLGANNKYDEDKDVLKWYQEYVEILSHLGWILEGGDLNTYEAKDSIFKVENVIIKILVEAFGNSFIGIITKTLNALKSPKEGGKLIAFETNSKEVKKGCFQIAAAVEENNAIVMEVGTFVLTSTSQIKQILFFDFSQDKTKLEYINRRATFNVESFEPHRHTVSEMLRGSVGKYISEINIA